MCVTNNFQVCISKKYCDFENINICLEFFCTQAWRNEDQDLGQYLERMVADQEVATLDLASGLEGRTRVESVRLGLEREVRRHMGLD